MSDYSITISDTNASVLTSFCKRWDKHSLTEVDQWYSEHGSPNKGDVVFEDFKAFRDLKIPFMSSLEVLWYLLEGGRHIDTAQLYLNHRAIGDAIKEAGLLPSTEASLKSKFYVAHSVQRMQWELDAK